MTPVDPETRSTSGWLRWLAVVLALAVLYFVTARLGLMLALPPEKKATAVWPPSGIALAALLLLGHRIWPGVWLGSFLANLWDNFNAVNPFPLSAHLFVSAGIATGSTLQALAGSFLVRRWTGSVHPFQQAAHAFMFVGVTMFVCLIAATFGAASLYLWEFAPAKAITFVWWTWYLGDMTGVLTVGSLLLTWSRRPMLDWRPRRLTEAALLLLLLLALTGTVFGIVSPLGTLPHPLAYLVIPFLVWATFRFGLHGAANSLCLVSALAVVGTAQGTGPFAQLAVESSLLLLQVFMGVIGVTVLVMAAVLNERQDAEHKARQWESVFNKASWAVAVADFADNRLKAVNPAFAAMHGFTVEELIGRSLADVFAPESRTELPAHVQTAHQRGDYLYESVHVRKDGTSFPCLTHVTTLKDAHGKAHLRAATFEDITNRKQAEEALRETEEQFRAVFNQTTGGIAQTDLTGRFALVNDRYCDIVGRSREELLTLRMHDITHPDDLLANAEQFRALVQGGPNFVVEKRYLRPDGSVVWVHNDVSALCDRHGLVSHIVAAVADITERKQAENALRQSEERFRILSETVPTMVWIFRPDGSVLHMNQRWIEYTGQTEKEYQGYGWAETVHPEDRPRILAQWKHCMDTGELYEGELRYRRHDGHYRWHYVRGVPLRQGSLITAWYGASLDIHEKKMLENELKLLNATLEQRVDERTETLRQEVSQRKVAEERVINSLREKEVLLKEVHHRVKNNLQIVSTLLDLQSEHTQDRQALEMFKESRGRVKSMALIHERLYHSQDLARVNFAKYIQQLTDDLYRTYKVSSDEIVLDVDVDVPPLAIDIAIPCGLLLNELLSNCFKHAFKDAEQGNIRVTLSRGGADTSILTVADDGVGFPHDLDFRHTTSFGMQLVNTLVEQLKGEITLTSHRGTAFTVTFPDTG